MSDARVLFERYVAQRAALGESPIVTGAPTGGESGSDAASTPGAVPPPFPSAKRTPERDREDKWKRGAPDIPSQGIVIPPAAQDLFSGDPMADTSLDQIVELIREECRAQLF